MRSIEEIQEEIDSLWDKIGRAEDLKGIFEGGRGRISDKKNLVENDAYHPFKIYDMTRTSKWRGDREKEAAQFQNETNENTRKAMKATSTHISELDAAIKKLDELIEKWKKRIDG
ncbi:hypothetical protein D6853_08895 [Butyrivibrio sp. X503]|uniref:hypothetical protein n=1 Tax=Butyrivibrio sp. X503 TaxID=2364878 RepID=UPI000EAA1560|nr:hypothetical protein [Butyrivibrio sp. X503]RKM55662.1 hypothetical protein D6853_08895 [Butyrivibrio sp. X503]